MLRWSVFDTPGETLERVVEEQVVVVNDGSGEIICIRLGGSSPPPGAIPRSLHLTTGLEPPAVEDAKPVPNQIRNLEAYEAKREATLQRLARQREAKKLREERREERQRRAQEMRQAQEPPVVPEVVKTLIEQKKKEGDEKQENQPEDEQRVVGICRRVDCHENGAVIIQKGKWVVVSCSEKCTITYHQSCWRALSRRLALDEGERCLTPDCTGFIKCISIHEHGEHNKKHDWVLNKTKLSALTVRMQSSSLESASISTKNKTKKGKTKELSSPPTYRGKETPPDCQESPSDHHIHHNREDVPSRQELNIPPLPREMIPLTPTSIEDDSPLDQMFASNASTKKKSKKEKKTKARMTLKEFMETDSLTLHYPRERHPLNHPRAEGFWDSIVAEIATTPETKTLPPDSPSSSESPTSECPTENENSGPSCLSNAPRAPLGMCVVCQSRPTNVLLVHEQSEPHVCLCTECAEIYRAIHVSLCPVCQKPFVGMVPALRRSVPS